MSPKTSTSPSSIATPITLSLSPADDLALNRLRQHPHAPDDLVNHFPNRRAAVLILIVPTPPDQATSNGRWGGLDVLLTKRASGLRTHGGEVALPGGKKDPEDVNLVATALREAEEEIGVPRDQVEILTIFPAAVSKHNLLVTPVVGVLRPSATTPFVFTPNPAEVDSIFLVPLARFLDAEG
ncbi:hypothetical protein HDU96_005616, partial [Phlyctochytrium bullatum]